MQLTHPTQVQTETINGHTVSYILKANRKDIAHLVVVFNDYRHGGWSFGNAVNFFKCNVLMIADVFENHQSCYMGANGSSNFAYIVACLIEKILGRLGLEKKNCTLLGASKGGYSALYLGIRFDFPNIVTSAPFGHLGSWMVKHDEKIARHVLGENYTDAQVQHHDQLLNQAIKSDSNCNKNIYFLVSRKDYFYLEYGQKELLLNLKEKYRNFNAFYTDSDLAFQHNQITVYFTQEILSLVNLLSNGIVVRLGKAVIDDIEFAQATLLPNATATAIIQARTHQILLPETPKNEISVLKIQDHTLYLEGVLYIQNYHAPDHQSLHKQLRLTNIHTGEQQEILLGTVPKAENSRELYQDTYFNYRGSGVATMHFKGIDISHLPNGAFKLEVSVSKQDTKKAGYQDIVFKGNLGLKTICGDCEYGLHQRKNSIYLIKKPIIGHLNQERLFELKNRWTEKNTFHVEGEFVVQGAVMPEFYMGNYYLLARNIHTGQYYSYGLGQVRSPELCRRLGDIYQDYLACYFATMHFKGIETTDWQSGEYEIFISLSFGGEIYSKKLDERLQVKTKGCVFV